MQSLYVINSALKWSQKKGGRQSNEIKTGVMCLLFWSVVWLLHNATVRTS